MAGAESSAAATAAPATGAAPPSCTQTLGAARAQKLVKQCLEVTTATHPPCNALNDCATIADHVAQMCRNLRGNAPASCSAEARQAALLPDGPYIEQLARTTSARHKEAASARERIKAARAKVEAVAAKQKLAASELKKGQTAFDAEYKAARAASAKLDLLRAKPGAVGIDATREAVRAQFEAAAKHGAALARDFAAIQALEAQMVAPVADVDAATAAIKSGLKDLKAAKTEMDAALAHLGKLTASTKTPEATAELAKAKATVADAAAASKAVQAFDLEAGREASALHTLSALTPAGATARAKAAALAAKIAQDQAGATNLGNGVQRAIDAEATKHRPDAPSAKASQCDLERFDFMNFAFPATWSVKAPPDVYKKGKLSQPGDAADEYAPRITSVKAFDLDGDGKKEAVVFIEGPPGAHSGANNELRFMKLDEQCRVQQFEVFTGGVFEGAMKGKSYVYSDTVFETPEGQSGNFAVGTESVEVRYVNGFLKEISRKRDPN